MSERSTLSELLLRLTFAGPDGARRVSFNDAPGAAAYIRAELFDAFLDEIDALTTAEAQMSPLQALGVQLLLSTAGLSDPLALKAAVNALADEKEAAARVKGASCH